MAGPSREFLESGCALIVGTVDSSGVPVATRGWGIEVVSDDGQFQLLVDADDAEAIANLDETGAIAITATHVPTLHSYQVKGRVHGRRPATDVDNARARRYSDAFFADVEATDGIAPHLMERLVPAAYVVYAVVADEWYDQTPGPGAGAQVTTP